ncbi:MAG: hypothetical protein HYU66_13105 [Armatimonadetes bacterium]|nr:hypothetical protein [Armatimonadota bacterium]
MLTARVLAIREAALSSRQLGDPQAGAIRAESLARTEGLPAVLREAHAYAHYCRRQDLVVSDGELIIGGRPGLTRDPNGRVTPAVFGRRDFGNANAIFGPGTTRLSTSPACSTSASTG